MTETGHESVRALRCAIYTRKSTEEGLEQAFNTLQAQREAAEAYIQSQRQAGWRHSSYFYFYRKRRRPRLHPMQRIELVCRARFPELCAAPGLAGAQAQERDLYEHLGRAAHLADPGCAGISPLQQRDLRCAGGPAGRGPGPPSPA